MEQDKNILVSVVIPTYNSENTIIRTLDSVVNQSYHNLEILLIDDGSNDNTITILREYEKKDSRVKVLINNENKGVADSRNKGIEIASGKYVAFLDGDDTWDKDKLTKQILFMENNDIKFSFTNYFIVDESNKELVGLQKSPSKISYHSMLMGNMIGCSTVIFDKDFVGTVSIPLLKKRNDMALWLKILKNTKYGYGIDKPMTSYYKSDNSLSSGKKINLLKYHYQVYRESENFNPMRSMFFTTCNVINLFYKKMFYYERISK